MRSRPGLKVWIHPSPVAPGETLRVSAVLQAATATPVLAVEFRLTSHERATVIEGGRYVLREYVWPSIVARHPPALLAPGEHRYRAMMTLPNVLPPTYRSRMSAIEHVLAVRVVIPWWLDRVGEYEAPVALPSLGGRVDARAGLFASSLARPTDQLYAECSLDNVYLEPGGLLYGRASFMNVHTATIRRVVVSLVVSERAVGPMPAQPQAIERHTFTLHEGPPPEGSQLPFALRLPDDLAPAFGGALFAVDWHIELIIESLWGSRTLLSAPVTVVPRGSVRAQPERGIAGAPVVGGDRRRLTWAPVARLFNCAYDEVHDMMRGAVGRVGVVIAVEQRLRDGFFTTARLRWAPLGAGLSIGPAQWSDRFSDREIAVGDAAFDEQFQVRGRFESQVRALCTPPLRALLGVSSDVRLRDDEATLSVRGAISNHDEVRAFTAHTLALAAELDRAIGALPPPPAVRHDEVEAWRAFADRLQGRFEIGRVYVHEGTWGTERVTAGLRWSGEGDFEATELRMVIDPPLPEALDPSSPDLAEKVRVRVEEIHKDADSVQIQRDVLEVDIARMVGAPASLEPVLDRMATLVRWLQGRGEAAPYR